MESTDRLIRSLYALAVEEDWGRFRALALERVGRDFGAAAVAWQTQDSDPMHAGEFTTWPADGSVSAHQLQSLPLRDDCELALTPMQSPPGARTGFAMRYQHPESRLVSRFAFWFAGQRNGATGEDLRRVTAHLVEANALALKHFILSDERLSRWGRSNRGTAAMVDARGTVYAASRAFRELIGGEFGDPQFDRLPFDLPGDASGENGSFTRGTLRVRAVKADDVRLLVYARKAQPLDGLSPREQEIARALSTGKTFKSVARQCGIATSTVANHASRIYRKLGIYRREELFEMIRAASGGRSRPIGSSANA
ncbi:MAG TPA: helix-turn-helix transcriptional regulator [Verrucomicrobiae bacterium]|nr:helix-turn-helix transcriptional regulator [Verrucomicrobiae bacterium]